MVYNNGNIYEGRFKNWKPHGQGTLTLPDGTKMSGDWKKGKLKG